MDCARLAQATAMIFQAVTGERYLIQNPPVKKPTPLTERAFALAKPDQARPWTEAEKILNKFIELFQGGYIISIEEIMAFAVALFFYSKAPASACPCLEHEAYILLGMAMATDPENELWHRMEPMLICAGDPHLGRALQEADVLPDPAT